MRKHIASIALVISLTAFVQAEAADAARQRASKAKRSGGKSRRGGAVSIGALSGSGRYSSCAAVRAAGAAPIRSGDPGYSRRLDRDGDGIACE